MSARVPSSSSSVDAEALAALAALDTPTVCNALELVAPERHGSGFTRRPFLCLHPGLGPIVGFARTARIRAASPRVPREGDPLGDGAGEFGPATRMPYYEYVASGRGPRVVVIEDLDAPKGVGAFWGEVHTAVHKGLGALGVVTDGSCRDVDDSAEGFQVLAGSVGPSHAFVHVVDHGAPVTVHGMDVAHDDIVHADRHGAVVVPYEALTAIPEAARRVARREAPILAAARAPGFDLEALRAALGRAREAR